MFGDGIIIDYKKDSAVEVGGSRVLDTRECFQSMSQVRVTREDAHGGVDPETNRSPAQVVVNAPNSD